MRHAFIIHNYVDIWYPEVHQEQARRSWPVPLASQRVAGFVGLPEDIEGVIIAVFWVGFRMFFDVFSWLLRQFRELLVGLLCLGDSLVIFV